MVFASSDLRVVVPPLHFPPRPVLRTPSYSCLSTPFRCHSGESKPRPAVVSPRQVPVTQGVLNLSSAAENTGQSCALPPLCEPSQSRNKAHIHPGLQHYTPRELNSPAIRPSSAVNVARRGVERRSAARLGQRCTVRFQLLGSQLRRRESASFMPLPLVELPRY